MGITNRVHQEVPTLDSIYVGEPPRETRRGSLGINGKSTERGSARVTQFHSFGRLVEDI